MKLWSGRVTESTELRGLVSQEFALCPVEPKGDQPSHSRVYRLDTDIFDGGIFINLALQIFEDAGL
jgi:hypothetical protein